MKRFLSLIFLMVVVSGCKFTPYNGDELSAPVFLKDELIKIEK